MFCHINRQDSHGPQTDKLTVILLLLHVRPSPLTIVVLCDTLQIVHRRTPPGRHGSVSTGTYSKDIKYWLFSYKMSHP